MKIQEKHLKSWLNVGMYLSSLKQQATICIILFIFPPLLLQPNDYSDKLPGSGSQTNDVSFNDSTKVFANVNGDPLTVQVSANESLICEGKSTQITAQAYDGSAPYTYEWTSIPPGFHSTSASVTIHPTYTTTYVMEAKDVTGATAEAEVEVAVSPLPVVELGPDISVCNLETVLLSVDLPGFDLHWSTGSHESSIELGTTGIGYLKKTIWLEVMNENDCVGTDTVIVEFDFANCTGNCEKK